MITCIECDEEIENPNNRSNDYITNIVMVYVYGSIHVCSEDCRDQYIHDDDNLRVCPECREVFDIEDDYAHSEAVGSNSYCDSDCLDTVARRLGLEWCRYCGEYDDPEWNDDHITYDYEYFCSQRCFNGEHPDIMKCEHCGEFVEQGNEFEIEVEAYEFDIYCTELCFTEDTKE